MLRTIDLIRRLDLWVSPRSDYPPRDEDYEALRVIKYRLQSYDGLLAVCRQVKTVVEATELFEGTK